jgi:hypothetical protein
MFGSPEEMHRRYVLRARIQRLSTLALLCAMAAVWASISEQGSLLIREVVAVVIWAVVSSLVARCPFCHGRFSWFRGAPDHCEGCGF